MTKDAKQLMEEGWKAREGLEFETAEKLLNEAKVIFEQEGNWFDVTETLNHLAYSEKLKAIHHNLEGMKLAKEAGELATLHSTNKVLVLRALMSLANSAGLFEQALKWGYECLTLFDKPAPRADVLSHIATFQLRTGKLDEAEVTISEAETLLDEGFEGEREPHRSIWKSKILMTKALIMYNKGNLTEGKVCIEEALKIADTQNLKTRTEEIKSVIEIFD
ncbi:MAG: hypothetical protein WC243_03790 [Patescibacteria group bacterium]|jgi:tetratricopeptide (TPR) repeat protein